MPNLTQMFNNCMEASYNSRAASEVYAKLNEAGFEVYSKTLKETSGYFIKFDESSLALLPGQANQEYALPTDLTQVVHLAERAVSTENWRPMAPAGNIENVLVNQLVSLGLLTLDAYGDFSPFSYYGPFLDAAATIAGAALQTQKVRISPITDQNRFVQIVYTAKWLQITNKDSQLMLPDEGTYAMEAKATAKLLRLNNDSLSADFEAAAVPMEQRYMDWVRARQIQEPPTVEPMFDLD
jgi:hypothetical protein